jgi:hypothetical protein
VGKAVWCGPAHRLHGTHQYGFHLRPGLKAGEQQDELVTAHPRYGIYFPQARFNGHGHQISITCFMAVGVIETFEAIQIHKADR